MKLLVAILLFFFSSLSANAQLEKIIHQTFNVGDTERISLNIKGEVTLVPWAGNTVMTETKVELYEASPSILDHFLEKEQRYAIEIDTAGGSILLFSHDQERKEIRTRSGLCPEYVHVKVFVPDTFIKEDEMTLVKTK